MLRFSPLRLPTLLTAAVLITACGDNNTRSPVEAPGADKSAKTRVLEAGADVLQGKEPLQKLNMYLDGFHFYNGALGQQMEAHHFCAKLNEDVTQCVIYDGNGPDAKIMGIEYIVSRKLFEQLPAEEKPLWHSHAHEVKSGTLVAPGIPDVAEHELMEQLVSTYGKTFHTWHTDRDKTLPLGTPLLMMGFTKDGQIDTNMVAQRDKRLGISSKQKRQQRADIVAPPVAPGADAWEKGEVRQLGVVPDAQAALRHH
ncbi:OBAP family protein [Hymenobacter cellulosilyticus]|uniref:OBAP family protein n=1 Tax=Hymenobacter cellulosilyticus TaxID=2932248 RepID=A0A8T9Q6A8_9BACT|nr:OBAP family protein [Hymenobacter cellulosilyticus]UOQ71310.1 OBAP family protein [Hymenobacter cellulosilyticus]